MHSITSCEIKEEEIQCDTVMEISETNFCRLCADEENNGVTIFSPEGRSLCLETKILKCLRIQLSEDDGLPKIVCRKCYGKLDECCRFVDSVSNAQKRLRFMFTVINITNAPEEVNNPIFQENEGEKEKENPISADPIEEEFQVKEEFVDVRINESFETDDGELTVDVSRTEEDEGLPQQGSQDSSVSSPRIGQRKRRRKMLRPRRASVRKTERVKRLVKRRKPKKVEKLEEEEEEEDDDDDDDDEDEHDKLEEDEDSHHSLRLMLSGSADEETETGYEGELLADQEGNEDVEKKIAKNKELTTQMGIRCVACQEVYTSKQKFDGHFYNVHKKQPTYQCTYCNKVIDRYTTFRSHRYRHLTEGRYKCDLCHKAFSLQSLLRVHILSRHSDVKPYTCDLCGKGFGTKPGLNLHREKHSIDAKREWTCEVCAKVLHTYSGYKAHLLVHKLGKRFMCDICGKCFTQKVNMQQHLKCHTGERPYSCEICHKHFAEKSHLVRHYSFHSDVRPYTCPVCSKTYKTERCLKVHSLTHASTRPYVCAYCGKGFISSTKLKQHCNIHTGQRPYACNFCERTFTNYPNYLKHVRRRHPDSVSSAKKVSSGGWSKRGTVPPPRRVPMEVDQYVFPFLLPANSKMDNEPEETDTVFAGNLVTSFTVAAEEANVLVSPVEFVSTEMDDVPQ